MVEVIFTNVRSIKNKLEELKIQTLSCPSAIMCMSETWLDPTIEDRELLCDSHHVFRGDRCINGKNCRGGGVAILVPHIFTASMYGSHHCTECFEAIAAKIDCKSESLIILNVYRPPNAFSEKNFVDEFTEFYHKSNFHSKNVLIVGDFNLPYIDWKNERLSRANKCSEDFLRFCLNSSLTQIVDDCTRGEHVLDIALVSNVTLVEKCHVLEPLTSSDHAQVLLKLQIRKTSRNNSESRLNFFEADYCSIERILVDINWEFAFTQFRNIDEKVEWLNSLLLTVFESYTPKFNARKQKFLPKRLRRTGNKLRRTYYKIKRGRRSALDHSEYAAAIKNHKREIDEYFRQQEQHILDSKSQRKFWSLLRSKTSCRPQIPALHVNSQTIVEDSEKAEEFNKYFSSVFTTDDGRPPATFSVCQNSLEDISFSVIDVYEQLQKQSKKLSCGPDNIPHLVYKRLSAVLALPLYLIFRESLTTGTVPKAWKEAVVTPVLKKGSKSAPNNYRPISLTCIACRIFEKVIAKAILDFCEQSNLLSTHQFGFLRRKSTTDQMLCCLNSWTTSIENNEMVEIAYLDFMKAFDSVSHSKLISILDAKGIRGNLLRWIKNFLSGRTQSVCINDVFSQKVTVASGVPQGSVLGPILFIIYIADICKVVKNCELYLYADDCKLSFAHNKNSPTDAELQCDLNSISQWADRMQLKLAASKCKILTLNKPRTGLDQREYFIQNQKLEEVNEMKDLGIIIDDKLSFESHCISKTKQASNIINFIFRAFKTRDTSFLLKLYKTYVLPVLDYGSVIYNPCTAKNIKMLESVQRHFTKRIPQFFRTNYSYEERLKLLQLETLDQRRQKLDLCKTYKIIYGHSDLDARNFFDLTINNNQTRTNGLKIRPEKCRYNKRKYFFSNRVTNAWNKLPRAVVTAHNVALFKSQIDNL